MLQSQNPYASPRCHEPSRAVRYYDRIDDRAGDGARALLVQSKLLYRRVAIEAPIEAILEWRAYTPWDRILIDGKTMASKVCWVWIAPRFEFSLPSANRPVGVEVDVRVWPWLAVRWLRIAVDGQVVYEEKG